MQVDTHWLVWAAGRRSAGPHQLQSFTRSFDSPNAYKEADLWGLQGDGGFPTTLWMCFTLSAARTRTHPVSTHSCSSEVLETNVQIRRWRSLSPEQSQLQEAIHKNNYRALIRRVKVFSQGSVCVCVCVCRVLFNTHCHWKLEDVVIFFQNTRTFFVSSSAFIRWTSFLLRLPHIHPNRDENKPVPSRTPSGAPERPWSPIREDLGTWCLDCASVYAEHFALLQLQLKVRRRIKLLKFCREKERVLHKETKYFVGIIYTVGE